MRVFAIADSHLSGAVDKPMDVFGPAWERHAERLAENWTRVVADDDVVLVAGDISWALKLEDALVDLRFLDALPGRRKILLKGNHDYWWSSRAKVQALLPPTMELLQNNCIDLGGGVGVVGTRGWSPPSAPHAKTEDEKIYQRELGRLQMSLDAAKGKFERLVAMLHYPPLYRGFGETAFVELLENAGVEVCVYGHLHGNDHRLAVEGVHKTIRYAFVAGDAIDFTPVDLAL